MQPKGVSTNRPRDGRGGPPLFYKREEGQVELCSVALSAKYRAQCLKLSTRYYQKKREKRCCVYPRESFLERVCSPNIANTVKCATDRAILCSFHRSGRARTVPKLEKQNFDNNASRIAPGQAFRGEESERCVHLVY